VSLPSPEHARDAVRRLTPLPAREIVELGRGTDSVAYLVDGEWVARFPAVPAAQATLRHELALLPELGPALPLATPAFEHVGRSGTELLFVAYRAIPGTPLTAEAFDALGRDEQEAALASLAEFLRALHAFPVELARRAGVREERLTGGYNRQQRSLHRARRPASHGRARLGRRLLRRPRLRPRDRLDVLRGAIPDSPAGPHARP